jgi:hypothetical protein
MSKKTPLVWFSWFLSTALTLFLGFVAMMELSNSAQVQEGFAQLGYTGSIPAIGTMLLVSVIFYAIPRTTVLGAVLLTGYFGGAIVTHLFMNQSVEALIPFFFGVAIWTAVWLRSPSLRALMPVVKK